jgi:hypothetical protein
MEDKYSIIHGYYPEAEDRLFGSQADALLDALGDSEGPECVGYDGRYACAVRVNASFAAVRDRPVILIGGLHHEPLPEEPFEDLIGSDYVPEVKASDVVDAKTLKLFVEGALEAFRANFGISPMVVPYPERFRPVMRREGGYWNHGDIYLFFMFGNQVIFNGNDQALEDTTLNITDLNGCNVGDEIMRVLAGEDRECPSLGLLPEGDTEGYLEYLWDNPDVEGDEDRRFDDPAFGQRVSPGITPKLGYVQSYHTPFGIDAIVGAGVYPKTTEDTDDSGCALSGHGAPGKSALLNLLLIGLILAVGARRRA